MSKEIKWLHFKRLLLHPVYELKWKQLVCIAHELNGFQYGYSLGEDKLLGEFFRINIGLQYVERLDSYGWNHIEIIHISKRPRATFWEAEDVYSSSIHL